MTISDTGSMYETSPSLAVSRMKLRELAMFRLVEINSTSYQ